MLDWDCLLQPKSLRSLKKVCHDAGSSGSDADSPHGSTFASALHHASLKVASWNGEPTAWLLQLQGTLAGM